MKRLLATVCATLWVLPSALYAQGLGASQLILTNSSGGGVILQPDPTALPPLQPLLITPPPAAGHQLVYTPAWTLNRLVKWTNAAAPVLGNSLISDDGTTVEIGNGNLSITNADGTARELRLYEPFDGTNNYTAFRAQAQASNITYTLPASLTPTSTVAAGILQTDGSGNLSWVTPAAVVAAGGAWLVGGNTFVGAPAVRVLGITSTNGDALALYTDNAERVRITAAGEVVVQNQAGGTPTTVLQVLGGNNGAGATRVIIQAGANQGGEKLLEWRANSGDILGVIDADGLVGIGTDAPGHKLHVVGNGTASAVFVEGGVGVGTVSPLATLHVYDEGTLTPGATKVIIQAGANQGTENLLEWQNNSGTILGVIDAGGRVGIGTNTPAATLHVDGTVAFSGTETLTNTGSALTLPSYVAVVQIVDGAGAGNINVNPPTTGTQGQLLFIRYSGTQNLTLVGVLPGGGNQTATAQFHAILMYIGGGWRLMSFVD
jgi:hypothetical protein